MTTVLEDRLALSLRRLVEGMQSDDIRIEDIDVLIDYDNRKKLGSTKFIKPMTARSADLMNSESGEPQSE